MSEAEQDLIAAALEWYAAREAGQFGNNLFRIKLARRQLERACQEVANERDGKMS